MRKNQSELAARTRCSRAGFGDGPMNVELVHEFLKEI
jgi:hypothetical protein